MKKLLFILFLIAGCSTPSHTDKPVPFVQANLEEYYNFTRTELFKGKDAEAKIFAKKVEKSVIICKDECVEETKKSIQVKNIPFKKSNFATIQSGTLLSASQSLKRVNASSIKVDEIINYSGCPRNMSAAVIKKLEYNEKNKENINKLFSHLSGCDYDKSLEIIYLRQALISFHEGNADLSQKSIKAILDNNDLDDPARVHYWAGIILEDKTQFKKALELRPYSVHAIKSAEMLELNYWNEFSKKQPILEVRDDSALTNKVEQLLYFKHQKEAFKLLLNNINQFKEKPGQLLYLIKLINRNSQLSYTVRLVSSISYRYPEFFNLQFITLSYQRPWETVFSEVSDPLDVNLLLALTKQESAFDPLARSPANARGLMQLIPSTARMMSKKKKPDLYNPETNIMLGSMYFKSLYTKFNSVEKSLASYNAGPGNVVKWEANFKTTNEMLFMDLIPFQETRTYVATIMRNKYFYDEIYKKNLSAR